MLKGITRCSSLFYSPVNIACGSLSGLRADSVKQYSPVNIPCVNGSSSAGHSPFAPYSPVNTEWRLGAGQTPLVIHLLDRLPRKYSPVNAVTWRPHLVPHDRLLLAAHGHDVWEYSPVNIGCAPGNSNAGQSPFAPYSPVNTESHLPTPQTLRVRSSLDRTAVSEYSPVNIGCAASGSNVDRSPFTLYSPVNTPPTFRPERIGRMAWLVRLPKSLPASNQHLEPKRKRPAKAGRFLLAFRILRPHRETLMQT